MDQRLDVMEVAISRLAAVSVRASSPLKGINLFPLADTLAFPFSSFALSAISFSRVIPLSLSPSQNMFFPSPSVLLRYSELLFPVSVQFN